MALLPERFVSDPIAMPEIGLPAHYRTRMARKMRWAQAE
jgi:hypothetical protein